jgi:hypothetical protein
VIGVIDHIQQSLYSACVFSGLRLGSDNPIDAYTYTTHLAKPPSIPYKIASVKLTTVDHQFAVNFLHEMSISEDNEREWFKDWRIAFA